MSHIVRRPILVGALGSPCSRCGMAMQGDRHRGLTSSLAPAATAFGVTKPSVGRDAIRPRAPVSGALAMGRACRGIRCTPDVPKGSALTALEDTPAGQHQRSVNP